MFRGPGWVESFVSLKGVGGRRRGFVFSAVTTAREQWLVSEWERQRWPQCRGTRKVSTLAGLLSCRVVLLSLWPRSLAGLVQKQGGCSHSPETLGGKRSLERHLCSGSSLVAIVLKSQYVEPTLHSHPGE